MANFNLSPVASSVFILFLAISADKSYAGCTLTNLSKAEKEPDGQFSVSVSGDDCDLTDLLGKSQKDSANYGNINYGHIETTESKAGDYGDLVSDVSGKFTSPDDYLIIMSQRPAGYTLSVESGAVLSYDKSLFVDSNVSNSHGLTVYGEAVIGGNLVVKSAVGGAPITYWNRAIYMSGGTLSVGGDLESFHLQTHRDVKTGGSNVQIAAKSTINVNGDAYIHSRAGTSLLHVGGESKFSANGSLTLFAERVKSSLTVTDTNDYGYFSLQNANSHIDSGDINIYTQGFNGISQSGDKSTLETEALLVDTTLADPLETKPWSSPASKALVIGGAWGGLVRQDLSPRAQQLF